MFQALCLFFPSFISITFYNFLNNSFNKLESPKSEGWIGFLTIYGSFCAINNLISLFIFSWLWKIQGKTSINGNLSDDYVSKKFLLIGIIVAIITAFIAEIIHTHIKLKITVEEEK